MPITSIKINNLSDFYSTLAKPNQSFLHWYILCTGRLSKIVLTADCDTLYTIYSIPVRTLLDIRSIHYTDLYICNYFITLTILTEIIPIVFFYVANIYFIIPS